MNRSALWFPLLALAACAPQAPNPGPTVTDAGADTGSPADTGTDAGSDGSVVDTGSPVDAPVADSPTMDAPSDDVPVADVPTPTDVTDVPVVDAPVEAGMACSSDTSCPGGRCARSAGACVQCVIQEDCPVAGQICASNRCVAATHCASSRACTAQVCDTSRGICVDCLTNDDCPTGQACRANLCVPAAPCRSSRECNLHGQVCAPTGVCVDCATDPDCDPGQFCGTEGLCHAQVCPPGRSVCTDLAHRRVCDSRGATNVDGACTAGQSCIGGSCVPQVCVPGATSCASSSARQVCNADGLGWTMTACGATESCSAGTCQPRSCTPGVASCPSAGARQVCNSDGLGYTTTSCGASQSCTGAGVCTPWACVPGTATCTSTSMRQVCNADGLGATLSSCTARQTCSGSACIDWTCTPGDTSCSGTTAVSTCRADGLGYEVTNCGTSSTCTTGRCTGWLCNPSSTTCISPTTLQACNADGLGSMNITCGASANAPTSTCTGGECAPNCTTGFGDCDGNASNGCETDVRTSAGNCGACGRACAPGQNCTASACVAAPLGNDHCSGATAIDWTNRSTTISVNTAMATNDLAGSCDSNPGVDVFYRFTVPGPNSELVWFDTIGSSYDTVLYFASDCTHPITASTTTGDVLCNNNINQTGCTDATGASNVFGLFRPGTYYLVLDATSGGGAAVLHMQHLPVGVGALSTLAAGVSTRTGTTVTGATGYVHGACGNVTGATTNAPEDTYWWRSCPAYAGGTFTATACGGAAWDTVFYVFNGNAATTLDICNDDTNNGTCTTPSTLTGAIPAGAGLHTFYVDGYNTSAGAYTANITRP